MSAPRLQLPVLQHWDCHNCSTCCREYHVPVTALERERIAAQGWEREPDFQGVPLFRRAGRHWPEPYLLNQREDGRCVFLSDRGLCRIHERFGAAAKPLLCRLFPFILVPAGDHWRVGARFACPSAAANKGRAAADHESDLRELIDVAHSQGKEGLDRPPPLLRDGEAVAWPGLLTFLDVVLRIVRTGPDRLERRLRKLLALARLCRQTRFESVKGARLTEFLDLVSASLEEEVAKDPATVAPPGWVGRTLFRQVLALYVRQDHGVHRGVGTRGVGARIGVAWRFLRGAGTVPRAHALLPQTTFERLEEPALPALNESVLERYYAVKVESLQFAGPTNFGLPFWDGLESLVLTYPVIRWVGRALAAQFGEQALEPAVSLVDNQFGYNRLLGGRPQRAALRVLARRGELERLVAWYGRDAG